MKLIKSLLLGTAAGFAATAGAQAADLPSKKAAPVDYVRVCSINNAFTGFVIPGSDICLKIGGFVRYNAAYNSPSWQAGNGFTLGVPNASYGLVGPGSGRNYNAFGQQAVASIKMDARQVTEYGLLRSFFDVRVSNSGLSGTYGGTAGSSGATIDKAYIQFGGLYAGRTQSAFDFYADDASYGSAGLGSDHNAVGIGYSFKFAEGFYATVALEDPYAASGNRTLGLGTYGGSRAPDVIGAVGVEQGWGSAKLSVAAHQVWSGNAYFLPPGVGATAFSNNVNTWGYAVQGGVAINIPQLGPSDKLWLQAAYANGAVVYLGLPGTSFGNLANASYYSAQDFSYNAAGGSKLTTGWNVTAAFEHMWNPNWGTNIFGGYTQYNPGKNYLVGSQFGAFNQTGSFGVTSQADIWQLGGNVTWYPVKGLKIAGEVTYFNTKLNTPVALYTGPGGTIYKKSDDALQGYVRIQRDF